MSEKPFARLARAARVACAVLLAYGLTPRAVAGDEPTPGAPESLRSAVAAAWARSPDAASTDAVLDAAKARAQAASRPLYNPEVEVSADDEGPDRTLTMEMSMPIDLSGKRAARSDVARATLDVTTAAAQLRRRDFAQGWVTAWASRVTADRRVTLGNQRVALLDRFAELAERQFRAGDVSRLDRDLALLARDEAAADQASLLAERAAAEEAGRRLGGDANGPRPSLAPAAVLPSVGTSSANVEALPEWMLAQSSAEAARAAVLTAERDRIADPTLKLRGGSIDLGDGRRDGMYGLSISMPLFVRNTFRAEVLAAKADARAAAADLERVKIALVARADRTRADYTAVRDAWLRWHRSPATDVDERAALLERLWRAGELSTSDYLLQLDQTLDTALAGAALDGRLWITCTDYLAATGQLEAWLGVDVDTGS